jgi:hypothetical protein
MKIRWEKKLDIFGPIEQAERCLDQWLKEEKRFLPARQRQRVAALMARYFQYEDEVSDQLMLSFLRHYSGHGAVDMEDPTSMRMEIKAALDKSRERASFLDGAGRGAAVLAAFGVLLAGLYGWELTHRPITRGEQAELKALVRQIGELAADRTTAAIWKTVKEPLQVKSYQEMTWWDYRRSRAMLAEELAALKKN